MMKIMTLTVGEMGTNCYLCWDEANNKGVVIDPGDEGSYISEKILGEKIEIIGILLTHGHFDHIMGVLELKLNFKAPVYLNKKDLELYKKAKSSAKHWLGIEIGPVPTVDTYYEDGQKIEFGNEKLQVMETPGHTRGSISLIGEGIIFTGDTLFKDGVGRTDFSYSNQQELEESVKKIQKNKNFIGYPGHGEEFRI